ncbi:MAG TPA: MBL fold metallo-hydrolase [Epulopiscium sp.]|nr:MBL fold metallo-hydrolase [Candidatus Epulonipiscium sp.]
MEKLTILGTGNAMVTKCYNTCFTISDDKEHFLIDAGGGNTILTQLEKSKININQIHHVFISHNHNDHILGVIWVIRAAAQSMLNNKYSGNLNIYAHESSLEAIKVISSYVLQGKFLKLFDSKIIFHDINNKDELEILGRSFTFFDIESTKDLQFGFKTTLLNGKTLTFLGDEPYSDAVRAYSLDVDYLLHEAFCLYEERDIFKPYDKHHATAKDACQNASDLNAKSVILYHTEDKNLGTRKERYILEGQEVYSGRIYVPNDLEIIDL